MQTRKTSAFTLMLRHWLSAECRCVGERVLNPSIRKSACSKDKESGTPSNVSSNASSGFDAANSMDGCRAEVIDQYSGPACADGFNSFVCL